LVGVAVLVAVVVSGCGVTGDARTSVFRSPVYGYALDHPVEWSVVEADHALGPGDLPLTADGGVDILGRGASTRVSQMRLPGVIIGAQPVPSTTDVDGWAAEVRGEVAFMKQCERPDATAPLAVDGEPAVLLTYEECPEQDGFLHLWVATVHDGFGFQIIWFDEVGRGAVDRPELDALLAGFRFDG
jgi:hypothetical protein